MQISSKPSKHSTLALLLATAVLLALFGTLLKDNGLHKAGLVGAATCPEQTFKNCIAVWIMLNEETVALCFAHCNAL